MSLVTSCVILLSMIIGSLWIKSRKGEGRSAAALCYSAAIICLLLLGNLFLNNGHFACVGIKTLAIIGAIIMSLLINGTKNKKAKKSRTKRVVQNASR